MDRLIAMHTQHVERSIPPEVEAAWLHHRFTEIHPFQDGNGRIARTLASLVFLRASWFPLVIDRDIRGPYIAALEKADAGDLTSLIQLFSSIQKRAFQKALSLSENVLQQHEPLLQVIASATNRLRERQEANIQQMQSKAVELSRRLEDVAEAKFSAVASRLNVELRALSLNYGAEARQSSEETSFWFRNQIISAARQLGYYADTRTYRAWVLLRIREERQTQLILSFHSLGVHFSGVMAVSPFIEYRDTNEDGEHTFDGPHVLCDELFQFSFNEPESTIVQRFERWLDEVLLVGIDQWRRQL